MITGMALAGAAVVFGVAAMRMATRPAQTAGLTFNVPRPAISHGPTPLTRARALDTANRFVLQEDFKRRHYVVAGMRSWGPGWRVYIVPRESIPAGHAPMPTAPKGRLCLDLRLSEGAVVSTALSSC
jgi:hypothetical protein